MIGLGSFRDRQFVDILRGYIRQAWRTHRHRLFSVCFVQFQACFVIQSVTDRVPPSHPLYVIRSSQLSPGWLWCRPRRRWIHHRARSSRSRESGFSLFRFTVSVNTYWYTKNLLQFQVSQLIDSIYLLSLIQFSLAQGRKLSPKAMDNFLILNSHITHLE